ncbi:sensor domain-containing diguanylate cyclase [Thiomicrospira microaerophila]|uniref:sensor domain-containing diguanylate cyclase n=1 Tax=Thiomicrospira microaerophila TaxID=406020 RepID=UPI0005C92EDE|nr:sensor domain-containing diguanylate cyclase [Thiomicrospira microaerophila]
MAVLNQFRTQLVVSVSLILLVFTFVLSAVIWFKASDYLKNEIGMNLVETTYLMSDTLDRYMWSRSAELSVVHSLDVFQSPSDMSQVQALLDNLQETIPAFSWVGLLSPQGKVLAATSNVLLGTNMAHRPVFNQATRARYFGDVHDTVMLDNDAPDSPSDPIRFIDISYPIYDDNQQLVGVLAAHLSIEWIQEIMDALFVPLYQRKNIEMFVVSRRDNVVLIGPENYLGRALHLQVVDESRQDKSDYAIETWLDGKQYLTGFIQSIGYQDYPGLGWTILLRQDLDDAYQPTRQLLNLIWLIGSVFGFMVLVIVWILAGRIAHPLEQITLAAQNMINAKQKCIPKLKGYEEIQVLSNTLNTLVAQLTDAEHSRDRMKDLAHKDPLTGLANRNAMNAFLAQSLPLLNHSSQTLTVLFLDLDRFKFVNDNYGHDVGDKLLQSVAQRLSNDMRQSDQSLLVRLGGDEFVVLLVQDQTDPVKRASEMSARMIAHLNKPFHIDDAQIHIGATFGGAVWPIDDQDIKHVMLLADQALYKAKNQGKNRVVFHAS